MKSGVYCITTPNGSKYVGSTKRLNQRWNEHKSGLRRGCHENSRLQRAYEVHGDGLCFEILQLCAEEERLSVEQEWIDKLNPRLNICRDVNGFPKRAYEARARLRDTEEGRKKLADMYARISAAKSIPVEAEDGRRWPSYSAAARELGLKPAGVKALVRFQNRHHSGLRMKLAGEPWLVEMPYGVRAAETRRANGTIWHSDKAKAKMSKAKKGKPLSALAKQRAHAAVIKPVRGICLVTGETTQYQSARDAVRSIGKPPRCSTQICKALRGVKNSAYGFKWEYA